MNALLLRIFALPLLVTSVYVLFSFDHRWVGHWENTVDTITGTTVLTGPLIAAMGAWLAMRAHGISPVTSATARNWAVPARLFGELAALGTATYAVAGLGAVIVTVLAGGGGRRELWVLLVGPAVLALCAAVGVLAGAAAPYRITAVLTGAGVFLVGAFGPPLSDYLLRQGPVTGGLAGLRFDPKFWSLQLVTLAGVAIVLLVAAALLVGDRSTPAVGIGALGLVLAVLGATGLSVGGSERLITTTDRATTCAAGMPVVCVAEGNRVLLDRTAGPLQRAAEVARAHGIVVPARYEELMPGSRPRRGSGMLARIASDDGDDRTWVWPGLLTPAACTFWTDQRQAPPDAVFESQALLEAWIVKGSQATGTAWSPQARAWLATSDTPEAKQWALRTFDGLQRCDLKKIVLPWG